MASGVCDGWHTLAYAGIGPLHRAHCTIPWTIPSHRIAYSIVNRSGLRFTETGGTRRQAMALLTYEALVALRRQLIDGNGDLEGQSSAYTLSELAQGLRVTRGKLQQLVEQWTQEQLWTRPPHS